MTSAVQVQPSGFDSRSSLFFSGFSFQLLKLKYRHSHGLHVFLKNNHLDMIQFISNPQFKYMIISYINIHVYFLVNSKFLCGNSCSYVKFTFKLVREWKIKTHRVIMSSSLQNNSDVDMIVIRTETLVNNYISVHYISKTVHCKLAYRTLC